MIASLYGVAFKIWNSLIEIAMTLFTTYPDTADGGLWDITHTIYQSISSATIPIATLFFIIAIYKSVISTPPPQQATRFLQDAVKYCAILIINANLWTIMGYIVKLSDGLCSAITGAAGTSSYQMSMDGNMFGVLIDISNRLDLTKDTNLPFLDMSEFDSLGDSSIGLDFITEIKNIGIGIYNVIAFVVNLFDKSFISRLFSNLGLFILALIGSIVLIFIVVACSISIISSAFQRIIKPLLILPFAGIALAMGAGSQDISRSLHQYIKTLFGFCISGAIMVIAIKIGTPLCGNLINIDLAADANVFEKLVLVTVQCSITPIVIAGLIKGTDSIVSRMF